MPEKAIRVIGATGLKDGHATYGDGGCDQKRFIRPLSSIAAIFDTANAAEKRRIVLAISADLNNHVAALPKELAAREARRSTNGGFRVFLAAILEPRRAALKAAVHVTIFFGIHRGLPAGGQKAFAGLVIVHTLWK
jgi:hypothetical protein